LPWIPVSDGKLANTLHAVFSDASPLVGFYKIPFTFVQGDLGEFLLRMGCSKRYVCSRYSSICYLTVLLGLCCPQLSRT
jgi:sacsin